MLRSASEYIVNVSGKSDPTQPSLADSKIGWSPALLRACSPTGNGLTSIYELVTATLPQSGDTRNKSRTANRKPHVGSAANYG